jgi:hypothetical protein
VANKLPEDDERILRIFGNKKGEEDQKNLKKEDLIHIPHFLTELV